MQSIVNAASSALNTATTAASNAASTAANLTGLTSPTSTTTTGGTTTAHTHAEETKGALPVDATASEVKSIDADGLAVFEDKDVRHAVLVKINQLALDDVKHGLKELASLDLVTESGRKGIDFYHPQRYFTVTRPMGIDYIGEVEIETGKSIHIRVHKASASAPPHFHSLDTRPGSEGGAVFKTGGDLHWFDY